jgi:hypothetical protein
MPNNNISPYLLRPLRTLDEAMAAITRPVSNSDRHRLVLLALKTAFAALEDGDLSATRAFIGDAQLHLMEMDA